MFGRFFKALATLSQNTETLAQSVAEANDNFRANLGLDRREEWPALEFQPVEVEDKKNRRTRGR